MQILVPLVPFVPCLTSTGSNWDAHINVSDRYGAHSDNYEIELDSRAPLVKYSPSGSGANHSSACKAWKVKSDKYYVEANFKDNTLLVSKNVPTGVDEISSDEEEVIYYDMYGRRVKSPGKGIYIKVKGGKGEKVLF